MDAPREGAGVEMGCRAAQSKLALTMQTTALTRFMPGLHSAVSVHPDIISTKLLRNYSYVGRPVSDGADAVAHLCAATTKVRNG